MKRRKPRFGTVFLLLLRAGHVVENLPIQTARCFMPPPPHPLRSGADH